MKSVWADALGGFDSEAISAALKACYEEPHCPNLPNFISMCRRYALRTSKQSDIDEPIPKDQAAKIIAEAHKRSGIKPSTKYDYKAWAKNIIRDYEDGTYKNEHGYLYAKRALTL